MRQGQKRDALGRLGVGRLTGAALAGFCLLCAAMLAILPTSDSPIAIHSCARFDIACRADAHPGVLGLVALLLAVAAGLFTLLTYLGDAAEERRQAERYATLTHEVLYETLHNVFHLIEVIRWERPAEPGGNEYSGSSLSALPVFSFRHAERMLDVPFAEMLRAEAAPVAAFLDHAMRNARFIDLNASSFDNRERVASQVVWLTEHLLRVLVASRHRSLDGGRVAAAGEATLVAANLDDLLAVPPATDRAKEIGPARELRDCVRFVRHHAPVDDREIDTTIALVEPDGRSTLLHKRLRAMADPPPRSAGA